MLNMTWYNECLIENLYNSIYFTGFPFLNKPSTLSPLEKWYTIFTIKIY